jgi:glyoxylase-like metal-dependent hydrolase (beta-lactamase superfamily II)
MPKSDTTIDLRHMGRIECVSSHVLRTDAGPVLVDTGPGSTLPELEAGLAAIGLTARDLHAILLTHIHLDHAGAVGLLAEANPGLVVHVHELGAKHLIDPSKLLASATRVFGANMERLWGRFLPVPASQIRVLKGGETIEVGQRRFEVIYTPGHAVHHVAYHEPAERTVYVGDVGGIRLPSMGVAVPVTPPPDFQVDDWRASIDRVLAVAPKRIFRTHYGFSEDLPAEIEQVRSGLSEWTELVRDLLGADLTEEARADRFDATVRASLIAKAPAEAVRSYAEFSDLRANYHGIAYYWRKKAVPA